MQKKSLIFIFVNQLTREFSYIQNNFDHFPQPYFYTSITHDYTHTMIKGRQWLSEAREKKTKRKDPQGECSQDNKTTAIAYHGSASIKLSYLPHHQG